MLNAGVNQGDCQVETLVCITIIVVQQHLIAGAEQGSDIFTVTVVVTILAVTDNLLAIPFLPVIDLQGIRSRGLHFTGELEQVAVGSNEQHVVRALAIRLTILAAVVVDLERGDTGRNGDGLRCAGSISDTRHVHRESALGRPVIDKRRGDADSYIGHGEGGRRVVCVPQGVGDFHGLIVDILHDEVVQHPGSIGRGHSQGDSRVCGSLCRISRHDTALAVVDSNCMRHIATEHADSQVHTAISINNRLEVEQHLVATALQQANTSIRTRIIIVTKTAAGRRTIVNLQAAIAHGRIIGIHSAGQAQHTALRSGQQQIAVALGAVVAVHSAVVIDFEGLQASRDVDRHGSFHGAGRRHVHVEASI